MQGALRAGKPAARGMADPRRIAGVLARRLSRGADARRTTARSRALPAIQAGARSADRPPDQWPDQVAPPGAPRRRARAPSCRFRSHQRPAARGVGDHERDAVLAQKSDELGIDERRMADLDRVTQRTVDLPLEALTLSAGSNIERAIQWYAGAMRLSDLVDRLHAQTVALDLIAGERNSDPKVNGSARLVAS